MPNICFSLPELCGMGLQVIMRRAHLALGGRNQGTDQVGDVLYSIGLAAIRHAQQAGRSIQAGAPIMALTATASVVFRLRYDFGIGRRDQAASKVSSRAYRR